MKRPCLIESNRAKDTDGDEVSHKREGLGVVEAVCLGETVSHQTRLVVSKRAIRILLEGVHPLQETTLTSKGRGTNWHVSR